MPCCKRHNPPVPRKDHVPILCSWSLLFKWWLKKKNTNHNIGCLTYSQKLGVNAVCTFLLYFVSLNLFLSGLRGLQSTWWHGPALNHSSLDTGFDYLIPPKWALLTFLYTNSKRWITGIIFIAYLAVSLDSMWMNWLIKKSCWEE